MTHPPTYVPIDCGLHDELQLLVMRGRTVEIRVSEGSSVRTLVDRLTDVYTREGAEWVSLASGDTIRLDRLIEVDGRPFVHTR